MSDTFVPFVQAPASAADTSSFQLKVLPRAEAQSVFQPLPENGRPATPAKTCARPSVTLQRQGEVVSSIRIECGCGQVIELACAY